MATDSAQSAIDWEKRCKRAEALLERKYLIKVSFLSKTIAVSKLTFYSSEDKAAHEETKKKLEEFEKQAAETLKKIQQLNADRDELKEEIDIVIRGG